MKMKGGGLGAQGLEQTNGYGTFSRANLPLPVALWFAPTVTVAQNWHDRGIFPSHVQTLPAVKATPLLAQPGASTDLYA